MLNLLVGQAWAVHTVADRLRQGHPPSIERGTNEKGRLVSQPPFCRVPLACYQAKLVPSAKTCAETLLLLALLAPPVMKLKPFCFRSL